MNKYDIHLHLSLNQLPKSEQFFISSAKNMLPHLEALDIKKGVLMSSGESSSHIPFGTNEECLSICKEFPNFFHWMCNVDMKSPDTLYERLKHYKEQGAVGVGELTINKPLDDPFLLALFKACEQLQLPILFHMSPQEGCGYGVVDKPLLPLLEKILSQFKELILIGHSQPFWYEISSYNSYDNDSRNSWGNGKVLPGGKLIELLEKYPNLYCDLSANSGGCAIMRDPSFGLEFIEKFQDRLLFGTDMVNTDMTFPLSNWLDTQYKQGLISHSTYIKICKENAKRILKI